MCVKFNHKATNVSKMCRQRRPSETVTFESVLSPSPRWTRANHMKAIRRLRIKRAARPLQSVLIRSNVQRRSCFSGRLPSLQTIINYIYVN